MSKTPTKSQMFLARLAVVLLVAFALVGVVWYGFTSDVRQRVWADLVARPGGPMTFRFILQPVMAAFAALMDGIKDAKTGRSPYLWTAITNRNVRGEYLSEALMATARIILLGLAMDGIYQVTVLKTFYPGEAAFVAIVLAFVPYLLLRGPIARVARKWQGIRSADRHR